MNTVYDRALACQYLYGSDFTFSLYKEGPKLDEEYGGVLNATVQESDYLPMTEREVLKECQCLVKMGLMKCDGGIVIGYFRTLTPHEIAMAKLNGNQ